MTITNQINDATTHPQSAALQVAFYVGRGKIFNHLVRRFSRSSISHCELVLPNGDCWSSSGMDGGVRIKKIDLTTKHWLMVPIPKANPTLVLNRIASIQGAKYDWLGILLSQLIKLGREHPKKYFCSEAVAFALGLPKPTQYSPVDLCRVVLAQNEHNPFTKQLLGWSSNSFVELLAKRQNNLT